MNLLPKIYAYLQCLQCQNSREEFVKETAPNLRLGTAAEIKSISSSIRLYIKLKIFYTLCSFNRLTLTLIAHLWECINDYVFCFQI